jgi:hypothetical protein
VIIAHRENHAAFAAESAHQLTSRGSVLSSTVVVLVDTASGERCLNAVGRVAPVNRSVTGVTSRGWAPHAVFSMPEANDGERYARNTNLSGSNTGSADHERPVDTQLLAATSTVGSHRGCLPTSDQATDQPPRQFNPSAKDSDSEIQ